ncbi:Uncharacterised protein [Mycobacteroides abscessus subsp. abscessus]|nr:Uncharacterised protein [Mycobacteroides abscessus subsp. abscessus]
MPIGWSIRVGFSIRPRTTMAAACSGVSPRTTFSLCEGVIIGVFTSGIWILVKVM